ncbi:HET-domain-containing protein [Corynespora cassiicola Philippines]|uniref:HET-domain-containing protein n=1 Tax=Corynespora cassiicola Philippines TaxID=1448308 RepID=A0A2T2N3K6_CORCC|nr:HET-domain-containing protein [Corynespora cassiicola Philippines]
MADPPTLCSMCSQMFSKERIFLYLMKDMFCQLMPEKCSFCANIVEILHARCPNEDFAKTSYVECQFRPPDIAENPKSIGSILVVVGNQDWRYSREAKLPVCSENAAQTYGIITQPQLPEITTDTLSDASIDLLKKKLEECQSHLHCNQANLHNRPWYPQRLLWLAGPDALKVYLVDRDSISHGSYFTLSHCWGDTQPARLLAETERVLRQGFDIYDLPRTFRDAILVCRKFNVPFLWIDSLCIFQDNLDDWEKEAKTMRDVYSRAHCNIAASNAVNSSVGLSSKRNPLAIRPFWIQTFSGEKWWVFPTDGIMESIDENHLNKRAWVFQERFLAKRCIKFTRLQVAWECYETQACESFPNMIPDHILGYYKPMDAWNLKKASQRSLLPEDSLLIKQPKTTDYHAENIQNLHRSWRSFVDYYTGLGLTKQSDRLLAMSGISELFSHLLQDKTVFGLRSSDILMELLWTSMYPESYDALPILDIPSWSWVGAKWPILANDHYIDRGYVPIGSARVIEPVEDTEKVIKGDVKPKKHILELSGKPLYCSICLIRDIGGANSRYQITTSNNSMEIGEYEGRYIYRDDERDRLPDTVMLGLIQNSSYHPRREVVAGLLLEKCNANSPQYQRVGRFKLTNEVLDFYLNLRVQEEEAFHVA